MSAHTDEQGLTRLIKLPHRPRKVIWETDQQPGGNDWSLSALLTFEPSQVATILKESKRLTGGAGARVPKEHLESWFPPAVRNRVAKPGGPGEKAGAISVDAVWIEPDQFVAPEKSPLIHGDAAAFEADGLVYLHLFTM
jgi:hypothetical protein